MEVIPDDFALIEDRLHHYVDDGFDFVFTTGGTGLTPDDVTPEASRRVIERDAPGFAEALRGEALRGRVPPGALPAAPPPANGGRAAGRTGSEPRSVA